MTTGTPLGPDLERNPHVQLMDDLKDIVACELAFRAVCEAAVDQLEPGQLADVVSELASRASDAIGTLCEHVLTLDNGRDEGAEAPFDARADDVRQLTDRSRLAEAVRSCAEQVDEAYDRALQENPDIPPGVLECLRELRSRLLTGRIVLRAQMH